MNLLPYPAGDGYGQSPQQHSQLHDHQQAVNNNDGAPTQAAGAAASQSPHTPVHAEGDDVLIPMYAAANDTSLLRRRAARPGPESPDQQNHASQMQSPDPFVEQRGWQQAAWAATGTSASVTVSPGSMASYVLASPSPWSGPAVFQPQRPRSQTTASAVDGVSALPQWTSPYPKYQGFFDTSMQAKNYREAASLYGRTPHLDPATDPTIAIVESNRDENVKRIYYAMLSGIRARDNPNSTARKRWLQEAAYMPELIEACAHKIQDCLMFQVKVGFRGLPTHDYCADERKGDDIDRDIDCAGRLENIIDSLEQEKTICEDVMNSSNQIRMFVNAPRAYATRKAQNRSGNSKRSLKSDALDSDQKSKTRKSPAKNARARSSTLSSTPASGEPEGVRASDSDIFALQKQMIESSPASADGYFEVSTITGLHKTKDIRADGSSYETFIHHPRFGMGPPTMWQEPAQKKRSPNRSSRGGSSASAGSPRKSSGRKVQNTRPVIPQKRSSGACDAGKYVKQNSGGLIPAQPLTPDRSSRHSGSEVAQMNAMLAPVDAAPSLRSPFQTPENIIAARNRFPVSPETSLFALGHNVPGSQTMLSDPFAPENQLTTSNNFFEDNSFYDGVDTSQNVAYDHSTLEGTGAWVDDTFSSEYTSLPEQQAGNANAIDPNLEFFNFEDGNQDSIDRRVSATERVGLRGVGHMEGDIYFHPDDVFEIVASEREYPDAEPLDFKDTTPTFDS